MINNEDIVENVATTTGSLITALSVNDSDTQDCINLKEKKECVVDSGATCHMTSKLES